MGCTNTKVYPEPVGAGVQAWAVGKGRCSGWRGLVGRIRLPVCGRSTKVVPIGITPGNGAVTDRTDFGGPLNETPSEDSDSAANGTRQPAADARSQSLPGCALPRQITEVMEVTDLENEPAQLGPGQHSAGRPQLADRPAVQKRVRRERPPARGGLRVELALYGKDATRPLPSCLSRAVRDNSFLDPKLRDDVTRAERRHFETQLASYRCHDGKNARAPSVASSCLDAFMDHERQCGRTKFGRKLHRLSEGAGSEEEEGEEEEEEEEEVEAGESSLACRGSPGDNGRDGTSDSADRGEFDFYS